VRQHWAPLLGQDPKQLTPGRLTYQLRRLRLHGIISRTPGSQRYTVTDLGLRLALFFTRSYARIIRPGMSEVFTDAPAVADLPLRRAFDQLQQAMEDYVTEGKLAA